MKQESTHTNKQNIYKIFVFYIIGYVQEQVTLQFQWLITKSFIIHAECPSRVSCSSITGLIFFFPGHELSELLLPIVPKEYSKWQKRIDLTEAHTYLYNV